MSPAELADAIAALSLDDVRMLVTALRARLALETFDEEAYRWANVAVLYGGAPDFPRDRDFVLVLEDVGADRLRVIAAVRRQLALSPQAAKEAVTVVPTTFGPFADGTDLERLERALRAAGATVSVRQVP